MGYKGVGAADPARKEMVMEASKKKVALADSVAPDSAPGALRDVTVPDSIIPSNNQTDLSVVLNHTDLSVIVKPMNSKVASSRLSARERLLAAADELFYEGGINLVGIDRVIERAGVAKSSLYDCFGSKEELIRCYLQARNEARQDRIRERIARHAKPLDKILSIFDLLADITSQPGFRGCAFLRAGADADADGKVKKACDESRGFLRTQFVELAREAGATNPEALGRQLVLLYDGAIVAAQADGNRDAPLAARDLARSLLDSATLAAGDAHP
jgi:AcrR family transcriptional regulator